MSRAQHLPDVSNGIGRGKEGPVEPTSSLRDEFRESVGHVGFTDSAFDVAEDPERQVYEDKEMKLGAKDLPIRVGFRDEFKAKDTL